MRLRSRACASLLALSSSVVTSLSWEASALPPSLTNTQRLLIYESIYIYTRSVLISDQMSRVSWKPWRWGSSKGRRFWGQDTAVSWRVSFKKEELGAKSRFSSHSVRSRYVQSAVTAKPLAQAALSLSQCSCHLVLDYFLFISLCVNELQAGNTLVNINSELN